MALSLNNKASEQSRQGNYSEALLDYRESLRIRQRVLGDNHEHVGTTYENMGLLQQRQGNYEEALGSYQKAYEIQCNAGRQENAETVSILLGTASVLEELGQYEAAFEQLKEVLRIQKKKLKADQRSVLGNKHLQVADNLISIGKVLCVLSRYNHALMMFRNAFRIKRNVLGIRHHDVAVIRLSIRSAFIAVAEMNRFKHGFRIRRRRQLYIIC